MHLWHQQNLNKLIERIVDQFSYLYEKHKKSEIYAMAMNTNSFCTTSFMTIAVKDILSQSKNEFEWNIDEWFITVDDGIYADDFLDQFNKDIKEYFGNIMLPKIQNGANEILEIEKNIEFYIQALKESKLLLTNKINSSLNNVIFLLNVKEREGVALMSANKINEPSLVLENYIKSAI